MALFVLRNLTLQMHMLSHPVRLDVWVLVGPIFLRPYFICANSEGSGETARVRRLARAFAGRLCYKYHNLITWLIYFFLIVSWSPQAIFILSTVAGLSSLKLPVSPIWVRAAFTASLMAPRTEAERSNGGSPTPWKYIGQCHFRSC